MTKIVIYKQFKSSSRYYKSKWNAFSLELMDEFYDLKNFISFVRDTFGLGAYRVAIPKRQGKKMRLRTILKFKCEPYRDIIQENHWAKMLS